MEVIRAHDVNDAWEQAKLLLSKNHVVRNSRNGEVWEYPEPVATVYQSPSCRVLFDPVRDANPFFHLMEGLWMLAGRRDVAFIQQFNQGMAQYSDDGETFHGAYGYRWRHHFSYIRRVSTTDDFGDQLAVIAEMLRRDPDDRRAVLTMWDPCVDLNYPNGKDLPCNTQGYFKIRNGALCLTVCCRSNDIIWGCYGANAVHMSMLLEYMAAKIGVPVGTYTQVSDSWHAYTAVWDRYTGGSESRNLYRQFSPFPMVSVPICAWEETLFQMMKGDWSWEHRRGTDLFFSRVVAPYWRAWALHKERNYEGAYSVMEGCAAADWKYAGLHWLLRREENYRAKESSSL